MLTELITSESLDVQVSVTQQAFHTLAEIVVVAVAASPTEQIADTIFAASICYLGERAGSVRLECAPRLAYEFTRRVIAGCEPTMLDNDVKDAIGELVNTIGGNLKGLLPAGVRLNTPRVTVEKPNDTAGSACLTSLAFDSEFGPCRLLLIENR